MNTHRPSADPEISQRRTSRSAHGRSVSLGFAELDVDRERRQGLPEVVYGPGKTTAQILAIVTTLLARNTGPVVVTRVDGATGATALEHIPDGTYDVRGRTLTWRAAIPTESTLAVVTAGTADGPVAAEAVAVARAVGLRVTFVEDVGVAGLHRILGRIDEIRAADVVVVVAGMEGALASVIGGLIAGPVVAVPTSTGYGASFEGVTALLAMLSSCAAGITVVNIDSGFGAAMAAFRLTRSSRGAAS